MAAQRAIERAFPGAPSDAEIVVTGRGLDGAAAQERLRGARRARRSRSPAGAARSSVETARDGRTAVVSVPMPDRGDRAAAERTVEALRDRMPDGGRERRPGRRALVTGEAAGSADFTTACSTATPIVIAFVLGLTLVLLLARVPLAGARARRWSR